MSNIPIDGVHVRQHSKESDVALDRELVNMSTAQTISRGERRKARTVGAILGAAEHEFVEHGYHRTRVEDISERADVAVGSIYAHFENKLGLYLAVVDRALTLEEEYLAGIDDPDLPPGERLIATGQRYLRFSFEHPGYFRLLASPPAVDRGAVVVPPSARRLLERATRLQRALAATVTAGVEAGQLRPVDPERTAAFLWGAWTGVISLHLRPDALGLSEDQLVAVLEQGTDIVRQGLITVSNEVRS